MKFIYNKFPDDETFDIEDGWTPLKESDNLWVVQLWAIPFMILNVAIVIVLMRLINIRFELNGYLIIPNSTFFISFLKSSCFR